MKFYTSENEDLKAAVVERFDRTLKEKMFRYFTYANTRRHLDVLDDLVHSYNNTHHRSIGMAPFEVNKDNEDIVRARLYPLKPKSFFTLQSTTPVSVLSNNSCGSAAGGHRVLRQRRRGQR